SASLSAGFTSASAGAALLCVGLVTDGGSAEALPSETKQQASSVATKTNEYSSLDIFNPFELRETHTKRERF
ncbi:hypothetical protein, partial [Novipirellula sp.]|uniref:hypothetical protein n=1 Tax=Novipirellula sp. TaxID=2795430 RepID=UPI00356B3B83